MAIANDQLGVPGSIDIQRLRRGGAVVIERENDLAVVRSHRGSAAVHPGLDREAARLGEVENTHISQVDTAAIRQAVEREGGADFAGGESHSALHRAVVSAQEIFPVTLPPLPTD